MACPGIGTACDLLAPLSRVLCTVPPPLCADRWGFRDAEPSESAELVLLLLLLLLPLLPIVVFSVSLSFLVVT